MRKRDSQFKEKYEEAIKGKYYNFNYMTVHPDKREEEIQKALKAGIARTAGGFAGAIALFILMCYLLTLVM